MRRDEVLVITINEVMRVDRKKLMKKIRISCEFL